MSADKQIVQLASTMSTEERSNEQRLSVTFGDDVEEAIPTQQRASNYTNKLTQSQAAWDIDGDGQLNETELALKGMDKTKKGYLSKEQMYQLMGDNLQTQREMFKMKKIVMGLVGITCVLAISNLGTSIAAAFLAKDTKNVNDTLVSTKTGHIIGTQTVSEEIVLDPAQQERVRKLLCTQTGKTKGVSDNDCEVDEAWSSVDNDTGNNIITMCERHNVNIVKVFRDGSRKRHDVCFQGASPVFEYLEGGPNNQDPHKMTVTDTKKGLTISVAARDPSAPDTTLYSIRGLLSSIDEPCDASHDCIQDAICEYNRCSDIVHIATIPPIEPAVLFEVGETCAADADCASGICQGPPGDPLGTKSCKCEVDAHCPTNHACMGTNGGGMMCFCNSDAACAKDDICKAPCAIADINPFCVSPAAVQTMHEDCFLEYENNAILVGTCALNATNHGYCPSPGEVLNNPIDPIFFPIVLLEVGETCTAEADCASGICTGPTWDTLGTEPKSCKCGEDAHCPVHHGCMATRSGMQCFCNSNDACSGTDVCSVPCGSADIFPSCVRSADVQTLYDDCYDAAP